VTPSRGVFVTFEGVEGSGKTTLVEMTFKALERFQPLVVREPGGTALGERVRELVLHTPGAMAPEAELYLFMTARAELIAEKIRPALADGRLVLADRYHDSSRAYQGGGRGVAVEWPAAFPRPDVTFLLAIDPETGLRRRLGLGPEADRLESEPPEFHRAVAAAYDRLAAEEPGRWVRLDARRPLEALLAEVVARVEPLLDPKEVSRSS
jgi:dTMP kinase